MTEQQVLTQLLDIGVRLGDGALAEADAELQELQAERDRLLAGNVLLERVAQAAQAVLVNIETGGISSTPA